MKCPSCGLEMESNPPLSKMGEPMNNRGVDEHKCMNPRCRFFNVRG